MLLDSCTFFTSNCKRWYFSSSSFNFLLRAYTCSLACSSFICLSLSIYFSCSLVVFLNNWINTSSFEFYSKATEHLCSVRFSFHSISSFASIVITKAISPPSLSAQCWPSLLQNHSPLVKLYFLSTALSYLQAISALFTTAESELKVSLLGSWTSIALQAFFWWLFRNCLVKLRLCYHQVWTHNTFEWALHSCCHSFGWTISCKAHRFSVLICVCWSLWWFFIFCWHFTGF